MAAIPQGGLVAVTGAAGFVGGWVVQQLLDKGYRVRACVRDPDDLQRTGFLRAMGGFASGRLTLHAADLDQAGCYDSVFSGCDGVAHLSHLSDYNDQARIQRVCDHIIASINAAGSVTRVVLTSSIAAIISEMDMQELVRRPVLDEDRYPDTDNPKRTPERGQGYSMGKLVAENAFADAARASGRWDAIACCPGDNVGPILSAHQKDMGPWQKLIAGMLRGECHQTGVYRPWMTVDVRDDAACHIALLESPQVRNGERYIAWSCDTRRVEDINADIDRLLPELRHDAGPVVDAQPERIRAREAEMRAIWAGCILRNDRMRARTGITFRPLDASLRDCVESLVAIGQVPVRRRPAGGPLLLDHVYRHEADHPGRVFLTQPVGGGEVVDYTWAQTLDQARRMAAHLQSLQLPPGSNIAMLAKNSAHFFMAELAIWMAGCTTVAIFPTETADNVGYVLDHCEARLLFIGKLDTWALQQGGVPAGLPCIALPLAPAALADRPGCEAWDAIVARTAPLAGQPRRAAGDLAMLLYTSGSTGQPKGVMQTFGSITAAATGMVARGVAANGGVHEASRVISYLPLAHCFERAWVECTAFITGDTHVFFSESLATFMADVKRAQPTSFISVPRLWTKFQQAVLAQMPAAQLDAALANPAMAAAVGQKVLAGLGLDHVRSAGSGSAPLPVDLLRWYRKLGLELTEGYAMTEDFAYSHTGDPGEQAVGTVGRPFADVQARIADDGEVLVKSPGQMAGYYKQPELNAECFTADGFFRTGDLGRLDAAGQLVLTGRKKELFKTAKGKYVAPAPIENTLNAHPMVELSMVSGLGQPAAYAVVVLDEHLRPRLADDAVRAGVDSALRALLASVNEALASHEQLQMLVVAREPWSMEAGTLTPTMKIKRGRIEASVAGAVDQWYASGAPVVWA